MYMAKRERKGSYRVFEPAMHERVVERLELQAELQRALELDQLELRYQPVVRLEEGADYGVEALLRWMHPTRGMIPPQTLHPARRGDRSHRPDRPLGPRGGVPPGRSPARALPSDDAVDDQRQPVGEAAPVGDDRRRSP